MPVYSEKCVDESAGFDFMPDGTLRPRKYGRYVLTIEEIDELKK